MTNSKKRDSGILPNGMLESTRDRLTHLADDLNNPSSTPPSNPNTWTSIECELNQFSGWRICPITAKHQLWIEGQKRAEVDANDIQMNPLILDEIFLREFGLKEVEFVPPPDEQQ